MAPTTQTTAADVVYLTNTSDRDVVVTARMVDDRSVQTAHTIPKGKSIRLLAVDAVALAQTRDYLKVSEVGPGEVIAPAISGVALGEVAGHDTVAGSDAPAVVPPTTTVVDDRHVPGVDDKARSTTVGDATLGGVRMEESTPAPPPPTLAEALTRLGDLQAPGGTTPEGTTPTPGTS